MLIAAVVAGVGVRLWRLDAPVAGWHAWRQADTAGFARCFYEGGMNFFRPQVLWGGAGSGEIGAELPLYPYVVALLYHVFGEHDAVARSVSLISWLLAAWVLFRLLRRRLGAEVAAWGTSLFLLFPSGIYYARAAMPEAMMVLLGLVGVDLFAAWMERGGWWRAVLSALAVALAIGIKVYNLWLGLPLLYLAWEKHRARLFVLPAMWGYVVLCLGIPVAWYVHATLLGRESGLTLLFWTPGSDKFLSLGILGEWRFYDRVFGLWIPQAHLTFAGLLLFVAGIWVGRREPGARLFLAWLVGFAVYLALVALGHHEHDYYQLLFLPAAAAYAGLALARWTAPGARRTAGMAAAVLLAGLAVHAAVRVAGYAQRERDDAPMERLAARLSAASDPGARVAVFDDRFSPILLYRAHRRGFLLEVRVADQARVVDVVRQGAVVLAGLKRHFAGAHGAALLAAVRARYVVLYEDAESILFAAPRASRIG